MARHKDTGWCLPEGEPTATGGTEHSWDAIHASILMDIRDELKSLNRLLHCTNFVRIPTILDQIARHPMRRTYTKKVKP